MPLTIKKINIILIFLLFTSISLCEINVYSHRHYDGDKKLFKQFTEETGIKVNVIKGSADQLIQRLQSEGSNSPADVLLTVDAGRLVKAKELGLLTPISSEELENNVPKSMRDAESYWFGLSVRARVIVFAKDRVSENELSTYEDLTNPKWKGRLVIRSSNNIYNQSLVASLIKNNGKKATEAWAEGVVSNMARTPKGNDRAQIMAVAAGEADIAVANTYYLALMLSGKKGAEQQEAAKKVKPFFPNQDGRGTHMNISCAGLVKGAPNKSNAIKLVEFLLSKEAQEHIVNNTFEYPMIAGVSPHELVVNMGLDFKQDLTTKVVNYGKNQAAAVTAMTGAGWK